MPQLRQIDRGALVTRVLLGAGLLLLGIVVAALLLRRPPARPPQPSVAAPQTTSPSAALPTATVATTAAPQTTSPSAATGTANLQTTTAAQATTPAAVRDGITIADLRVVAATPFSATVAWRTEPATRGRLALGPAGGEPTLWSPADAPATEHQMTVGGLSVDTRYRARVEASAGRHEAALEVDLQTPTAPTTIVASTGGGSILLDGQPFFPLMVWGECPVAYGQILTAGVNLLAQNPCGGADAQVTALAGRALSAGIAGDPDAQNPALIGWFYPDEADARRITARTLPAVPPSSVVGRISFLTLSNHFYSRAAPISVGRGVYRGLVDRADVVGFDLYPLQEWCQADGLDHVYDAQVELGRLAPGKPAFQWIEAAPMRCRDVPGTAVTPATVRAESWLAIVAGAHGLGFFPGQWTPPVAAAVASVTRDVKAIAPALLAAPVAADGGGTLKVAARVLDDAVYVVAVNPTRHPVSAAIRVVALGGRSLRVLGESRGIRARGGVISETFGPLAAHVYIAPPR